MKDRASLLWTCPLFLLALPGAAGGEENLPTQAHTVLKTHCARCHSPEGTVKGGFDYVLRADLLTARNKIVPGKAAESDLFQRVRDGEMPPRKDKARLSDAEMETLKKWIDAGAFSWLPPAAERLLLTENDLLRAIRQDLEHQPAPERRFFRYFSVANLANAGKSEDELAAARLGLGKLLNSLSWHPRLAMPVAIDTSGVVLRIDLRAYKWNARQWDQVVALYPYRIGSNGADAFRCNQLTGSDQPLLRADWFVATASRAPLYYDLLQMPTTDKGLERQLQVESATNIEELNVIRAGFNESGVSRNNRLIERHDAGYGAYWKTYDFSENVDRQNLFDRPLGPPPGRNSFIQAGGEMIFHLPNGLLGFFVADAGGRRIDRAPVEIVSDPNRPDRVVEAGISCFNCHAAGFILKADQVRAHVLKNVAAFGKEDVATVKALYVPEAKLRGFLDRDNERLRESLKKISTQADAKEPINLTAMYYEAVVDLTTAAAEIGWKPDDLANRLGQSAGLGRTLGALRARGGTVQRQAFVAVFPDLAKELRLGDGPAVALTGPVAVGHTDAILAIAFAANGKQALTGSADRTMRLWDVASGKELRRFAGHRAAVAAVAFSRDGHRALSGGQDRTLRLWDVATGQELRRFQGHTDHVSAVAFAPDGKRALSGSHDKTLRLWDLDTGAELRSFVGHTGRVTSVALAPNGKFALSGSYDQTVRLWDVATGDEHRIMLGATGEVYSVAFAPDGLTVVAGGNDRMVRLWETESGQELKRLEGHANAVIRVAFTPNGRFILSGSSQYHTNDRTIRVWEVAAGREVRGLDDGKRDRISCLAFSPDGQFALTDGSEPILRLWKLAE